MTDANTFFGYFVRFIATWKTAEIENEKRRQMEARAAAALAAKGLENQEEEGKGVNKPVGRRNNVRVNYFFFLFKKNLNFLQTLLDLTDVCPLLTKQYIQVGLQIQYVHVIQFLDGLSLHTWYG
jgi:hypothetical protein